VKSILTVSIEFSVRSGHVFYFSWFEKKTLGAFSADFCWINAWSASLRVHDVLMMEILNGTKEVLAVA
jgi:hypothetical protein